LVRLSREVPNIVAVKDAAGNPGRSAALVADAAAGFELYSGDDSLTLPLLAVGAVGVVGVATHWSGREHQELVSSFEKGDVARAREVNASLLASFAYESGDEAPNPVPAKAMMRALGFAVGECRLPMGPTPPGLDDRARNLLNTLRGESES
jgi:4-hydroxy-tetrahydrodipicolinate synthase